MMIKSTTIALVTAGVCIGGCATSELTQQKMIQTRAAIDATQEFDESADNPDVALHLKYANDQLAVAKELIDEGEERAAQRMLDRAHSDAELALALARTDRSRGLAEDARKEVEMLRNGTNEPGFDEQQGMNQGFDDQGIDQ